MVQVTLLIHHLFTGLALAIMSVRLFCHRVLFQRWNVGDYLTMVAMVCAAARDGLIHVVLTWGTNNISKKVRAKIQFTPEEIYRREIGSKFAIANRPIYNSYLWLQKLVLLHFYLTTFHPEGNRCRYILWSYSLALLATYIPAQIVGFTECDPFHLYWQVVPPPGRCAEAQVQLMVLGVLSIVTDVMLLALPLPVLISLRTPLWTKLRLSFLCTLGLVIIAVTIVRLPINHLNAAVQANRSLWASTELLAAAVVVNTPVLYGSFNRWRQNKTYLFSSRQDKFSEPSGKAATGHSKHSAAGCFSSVSPKEDESPLCIVCQTTVRSESTHALNCQNQGGIFLTTIEASSLHSPEDYVKRAGPASQSAESLENGKSLR